MARAELNEDFVDVLRALVDEEVRWLQRRQRLRVCAVMKTADTDTSGSARPTSAPWPPRATRRARPPSLRGCIRARRKGIARRCGSPGARARARASRRRPARTPRDRASCGSASSRHRRTPRGFPRGERRERLLVAVRRRLARRGVGTGAGEVVEPIPTPPPRTASMTPARGSSRLRFVPERPFLLRRTRFRRQREQIGRAHV